VRRRTSTAALTAILVIATPAILVTEAAASRPRGPVQYQPDGWIKLCGQSLGCTMDPPPHPWRGRDVYNTTGRRQTEKDRINEGEGIRYWIMVQNDGTVADTIHIDGCRGNRTFEVNRVLLGKHKRQDASATDLTRKYKRDRLKFDLDVGEKVVFTLNIITHFNKGVTYRCETLMTSKGDTSSQDVVVAEMTTY
jgi:hypothetical protein